MAAYALFRLFRVQYICGTALLIKSSTPKLSLCAALASLSALWACRGWKGGCESMSMPLHDIDIIWVAIRYFNNFQYIYIYIFFFPHASWHCMIRWTNIRHKPSIPVKQNAPLSSLEALNVGIEQGAFRAHCQNSRTLLRIPALLWQHMANWSWHVPWLSLLDLSPPWCWANDFCTGSSLECSELEMMFCCEWLFAIDNLERNKRTKHSRGK